MNQYYMHVDYGNNWDFSWILKYSFMGDCLIYKGLRFYWFNKISSESYILHLKTFFR